MCEAAICDKKCKICGTVCMKRGASVVYANEVIKKDVQLVACVEEKLPYFIPILPDRLKKKLSYEIVSFIALHGGIALKSSGEGVKNIYKKNGFKKALNVDERCKALLEFYVKDRTLEGFWNIRHDVGFFEDLKKLDVIVIAPNFSLYEDAPRIEHLYNIKRSLIMYNKLVEHGIKAIPDIAWYNRNDIDFWIEQINKSKCSIIAYSFQVVDVRLKASNLWRNYLAALRYMAAKVKENVKCILVVGVNSETRMQEIRKAVPYSIKISVLNQSAYTQSQRGMYSKNRASDKKTDRSELFEKNIKYFNEIYKKLNEGEEVCQKEELEL